MLEALQPESLDWTPPAQEAVRAWRRLTPARAAPDEVSLLQAKGKDTVCALRWSADPSAAVIAKRSPGSKAATERAVYEHVLPSVGLDGIQYFGFIDDEDDADYCWIFLSDGSGEPYLSVNPVHRVMSARWLALMHVRSMQLPAPVSLPLRGAAHYLDKLAHARRLIADYLCAAAVAQRHVETLRSFGEQLAAVELGWGEIDRFVSAQPACVIHGDFAPKNMFVRRPVASASAPAPALNVFDFGTAGWGAPAADLVQGWGPDDAYWASPDLHAYCSVARELGWPLQLETARALAAIGKIFRSLVCICGDCASLRYRPDRTIGRLRVYCEHLAQGVDGMIVPERSRRVDH